MVVKCRRSSCTRKPWIDGWCAQHWTHRRDIGLAGTWDASEAAEHLRKLVDLGWTPGALHEATGVGQVALWRLRKGIATRIIGSTRHAILTVPLGPPPEPKYIDCIGTTRRIQALQWMGWPHSEIADRAGVTRHLIKDAVCRRRCAVHVRDAVERVYDELWSTQGPCRVTAGKARGSGHAPPLAWDNIDDPDETPQTGKQVPRSSTVVVSEARFLARFGTPEEEIAKRLGVTVSTLRGYLGRAA